MATTQTGGDLNKSQYIGEHGNQAVFDGYYKAAGASADTATTVDLFTLPAGAKVFKAMAAWTAHGASGAATLGWRYKNGQTGGTATALLGSTSTVSAGSATANFIPQALTALGSSGNGTGVFDDDVVVYITFSGRIVPAAMEFYVALEGAYAGTR